MIYWHETSGRKGANEIASINLKYVRDNFTLLTQGEERELVIWSDRCAGQNNNNYFLISLDTKEGAKAGGIKFFWSSILIDK